MQDRKCYRQSGTCWMMGVSQIQKSRPGPKSGVAADISTAFKIIHLVWSAYGVGSGPVRRGRAKRHATTLNSFQALKQRVDSEGRFLKMLGHFLRAQEKHPQAIL